MIKIDSWHIWTWVIVFRKPISFPMLFFTLAQTCESCPRNTIYLSTDAFQDITTKHATLCMRGNSTNQKRLGRINKFQWLIKIRMFAWCRCWDTIKQTDTHSQISKYRSFVDMLELCLWIIVTYQYYFISFKSIVWTLSYELPLNSHLHLYVESNKHDVVVDVNIFISCLKTIL